MFWVSGLFYIEPGSIRPTIAGIATVMWRKKVTILLLAAVGALIGLIASSFHERQYLAQMRVIANPDDQFNTSGGGLSALGALGGLAGTIKPERVSLFQQYIAIISSPDVAHELERRGPYLPRMFPDRWDAKNHRWNSKPDNPVTTTIGLIKRILNRPNPPYPTENDLARAIANRVHIGEADKTMIETIAFADKDPIFAKEFIQALNDSVEAVLLQRDRTIALRRLAAGEQELAHTTINTSRDALTRVLAALHVRAIATNVGPPYAAEMLTSPTVSTEPEIPNVSLYILVGFAAGALSAMFVLLIAAMASVRNFEND